MYSRKRAGPRTDPSSIFNFNTLKGTSYAVLGVPVQGTTNDVE